MYKLPLVFFLFSIVLQPLSATELRGFHAEYAGETIRFFRYSDPVALQNEPAFQIEFNAEGEFSTHVPVDKPEFVFAEFGIYRGMLMLSPGQEIELLFPPFRKKSFADRKNPYFEPVAFWFATGSGEHLTDQISAFDNRYNQLTDKYFNYLFFRQSREIFDTVTTVLNQEFPAENSPVLQVHKQLKLNLLKTDAFRMKTGDVAVVIEKVESEFWTLPSFIEFFGKIFSNKLSFEAKTVEGSPIRTAVAGKNEQFLLDFITDSYNLKEEKYAKLVLIKLLHDGYYSGEFPQDAILQMLKSRTLKDAANPIGSIAKNVTDKLEFLQKGTEAPVICLKNINGYRVCTDEFTDKYKYIVFADTEMIVCREQLKYLGEIQQKFEKHLQIVVVLRKTDLIEMKIFLDKQNIPGVKLVDENGKFIEKYKVQSFPVAFLLNKDHEIVFAHAKTPLDGFEQQFGPYLRRKLFEQQRNQ
jgi:peroxiredoxin